MNDLCGREDGQHHASPQLAAGLTGGYGGAG